MEFIFLSFSDLSRFGAYGGACPFHDLDASDVVERGCIGHIGKMHRH